MLFFKDPSRIIDQLVYSRQQGSKKFNFYSTEGKLSVGMVDNHTGEERLLPIKGLGSRYLQGLDDLNKREKLITFLNESYYKSNGFEIEMHTRGLGGWNQYQHKGYFYYTDKFRDKMDLMPIVRSLAGHIFPTKLAGEWIKYYGESNGFGEGTYVWKLDIDGLLKGIPLNSPNDAYAGLIKDSLVVADACDGVDYGETNLVTHYDEKAQRQM